MGTREWISVSESLLGDIWRLRDLKLREFERESEWARLWRGVRWDRWVKSNRGHGYASGIQSYTWARWPHLLGFVSLMPLWICHVFQTEPSLPSLSLCLDLDLLGPLSPLTSHSTRGLTVESLSSNSLDHPNKQFFSK